MKDIAIYGAGGFGREVACLIATINEASSVEKEKYHILGFFDDGKEKGTAISHYGKVLGGIEELNSWSNKLNIAIAIGAPQELYKVQKAITNPNVVFPNLIHPDTKVIDPQEYEIGIGNIIMGGYYASCNVKIGNFNILNGNVILGHDAIVGDHNVIMANVFISGGAEIVNRNLIGLGGIILQNIKIGHDVRLGAGAVLMTKPKDESVYIGNPAKIFRY